MHIQYTATRSIQSSHVVSALVTDSTIDTACAVSWTCGTGWAIAAGQADHTAGNTPAFSQTITFTAGNVYRVTYDCIGPATGFAGTLTASIGGASGAATSCPDNTTTSVTEDITAGSSGSLLELTPSSAFTGSLDNVYVSLTTQWDLYPGLKSLDDKFATHVKRNRTDYGNTRTIRRGRDRLMTVTANLVTRAVLEADYFEFFDSVSGGESFLIDPYRVTSGDSAVNPVTVIIEGDPIISPASVLNMFNVTFTVRVLPV